MTTSYRADIDGLRAVAVTAVVFYHAGLGTQGGFVGVDVFFVISGYLITTLLYAELEKTDRISLVEFYARRIGRIVPSLVLVASAVVLMAALVLSSTLFETHAVAKSAVPALFFSGNIYFYLVTSDYFAAASSQMPLLHTWSLGVEEQYYFGWPLILLLASRFRARRLSPRLQYLLVIVAFTLLSMIYCAVVNARSPTLAFFSPLTRFWELGLGSALALAQPYLARSERIGTALATVGFGLVLIALIVTREGPIFPWPTGLLACLGATAIIAGNDLAPTNPVAKALSVRPAVSIGRVSYAWYLWHWPPMAFVTILQLGEPPQWQLAASAGASLVMAYITVRYYEDPLRRKARQMPARTVVIVGIFALGTVSAMATATYAAARYGYLPDDRRLLGPAADPSPRSDACLLSLDGDGALSPDCWAAAGNPRVVVWGDSQANQWVSAIAQWASSGNWQVEQLTRAQCPPVLGLMPMRDGVADPGCADFNLSVMRRLEQTTEPLVVVLSARWGPRLGLRNLPGEDPAQMYIDVEARDAAQAQSAMERGLQEIVERLARRGIPLVLVMQSPVFERAPATCVYRIGADRCWLPVADLRAQTDAANQIIAAAGSSYPGASILDPTAFLCNSQGCPPEIDGKIAYADIIHVANSAAMSHGSIALWTARLDEAARRSGADKANPVPAHSQ
ncbi:MAG: acyltransferase family protein [Alteraurantiacibacter sp.]